MWKAAQHGSCQATRADGSAGTALGWAQMGCLLLGGSWFGDLPAIMCPCAPLGLYKWAFDELIAPLVGLGVDSQDLPSCHHLCELLSVCA